MPSPPLLFLRPTSLSPYSPSLPPSLPSSPFLPTCTLPRSRLFPRALPSGGRSHNADECGGREQPAGDDAAPFGGEIEGEGGGEGEARR